MPHTIRLRGPWQLRPLARAVLSADGSWQLSTADLPPSCMAEMPADWSGTLGTDFRGLVRFQRKFHRPTGLDDSSRIWLVIDNVDFQASVALNGKILGLVQLAGSPPQLLATPANSSRPHPNPLPEAEGTAAELPPIFPAIQTSPLACPARFDITALLAPANDLQLDILLPPDSANLPRPDRHNLPGGLLGLVRLEIE